MEMFVRSPKRWIYLDIFLVTRFWDIFCRNQELCVSHSVFFFFLSFRIQCMYLEFALLALANLHVLVWNLQAIMLNFLVIVVSNVTKHLVIYKVVFFLRYEHICKVLCFVAPFYCIKWLTLNSNFTIVLFISYIWYSIESMCSVITFLHYHFAQSISNSAVH